VAGGWVAMAMGACPGGPGATAAVYVVGGYCVTAADSGHDQAGSKGKSRINPQGRGSKGASGRRR
jgi:hypothetical protein